MSKALAGAVAIGAMIVALGWGASTVSAQDSEAVVKDRQATMKSQGAAMAGVKKYLDGDADQAAGTKSAEDLVKISDSLGGKFALVCAASKGLGKGCAVNLAREGVNLTIVARTQETIEATAAEIRAATGVKV